MECCSLSNMITSLSLFSYLWQNSEMNEGCDYVGLCPAYHWKSKYCLIRESQAALGRSVWRPKLLTKSSNYTALANQSFSLLLIIFFYNFLNWTEISESEAEDIN